MPSKRPLSCIQQHRGCCGLLGACTATADPSEKNDRRVHRATQKAALLTKGEGSSSQYARGPGGVWSPQSAWTRQPQHPSIPAVLGQRGVCSWIFRCAGLALVR